MPNLETQNLIPPSHHSPATTHHHHPPPPPPESTTIQSNPITSLILQPFQWLKMLSTELNPSFILGIFLIYGLSQGFSGSFFKVVTDYYWKDVQKVQPSKVQLFIGLYHIPWVMKPVWGLMTDVFPVMGYRRRPYFIVAGVVGVVAAAMVAEGGVRLGVAAALWCLIAIAAGMAIADVTIDACIARNSIEMKELAPDMQSLCGVCSSAGALVGFATSGFFVDHLGNGIILPDGAWLGVAAALWCLIAIAAGMAIADVTIDACIARNSIEMKELAPDMQSLCGVCSSAGALVGFATSGFFVDHLGPQIALGILAIPAASQILLGFVIYEKKTSDDLSTKKRQAIVNLGGALKGMYETIQFPEELVGIVHAIGALASIVGVLIYHKLLKDYPFRKLLLFVQLVYGLSGFLDLMFILRWNLALGLPDYLFVVMEECVSRVVTRVRWMPMIVLSTSLCPIGIEGTFFALLMSIDSFGSLSSKWGGAIILHVFHVTRTDFENLWFVILVRNLLRIATLGFIFLVPNATRFDVQNPCDILQSGSKSTDLETNSDSLQLLPLKERQEV
ncbi:hypothetical protein L1987_72370 [Smallanthus sonchifolius]|uniref:Uncharacterized protein n=1 Tax=Smallanthus sonchifolius TaxID=185202 RepID=A0ACB9AVV4_9ASTR|nr:hypothetical protein L1987_72370 [Smallanthus sonchifolius]